MTEAAKQFRRLKGRPPLPLLRAALDTHLNNNTATPATDDQNAA